MRISKISLLLLILTGFALNGQSKKNEKLLETIDRKIDEIEALTIEWRRHFHEYPELSNQEFETSKIIANDLGLEVTTGIAKTGVKRITGGRETGSGHRPPC